MNGKTKLFWNKPITVEIVGYRLYSIDESQSLFTLLTELSASSTNYQTDHAYKIPRRLYAISAIDAYGNESMLSESTSNTERVSISHMFKTFPWPMFLPAMTNNAQP